MSIATTATDGSGGRFGGTPVVDLTGVRKVYEVGDDEVVALDHATLQVHEGEIVALVGPSGSGKTTLCSIAGGILSASEGSVVVGGKDITIHELNAELRAPRH